VFLTSPESHYSEQKWLSYIEVFINAPRIRALSQMMPNYDVCWHMSLQCLAVLLVSADIVFITFKTDANSLTVCMVKLFVHIEFSNLEQQVPNNAKLWCAPRLIWTFAGVQTSLGACHCLVTSFIANNFFISVLEIWNISYYHEFWSLSCDFGLVRNAQIIEFKRCLLKSNDCWPRIELHAHIHSLRVRWC